MADISDVKESEIADIYNSLEKLQCKLPRRSISTQLLTETTTAGIRTRVLY